MVLPATPEEAQELLRHRHRWLRWAGGATAVVVVALLGVLLFRSDGEPSAEAAVTAAPQPDPSTSANEGEPTAPPDQPGAGEPPVIAEAVTVRGEGSDSVDLDGQFVEGHVVLRYSIAGSGVVILTDSSGTVLDGASVVVDPTTSSSGAVIVPRLPVAALASIEAEGPWELTGLSADNLPILMAGATIESSGNGALFVGDAAGIELAVTGDCADDTLVVELWDDSSLLSAVELSGSGSVPMLRATRYLSVRSSCGWTISA